VPDSFGFFYGDLGRFQGEQVALASNPHVTMIKAHSEEGPPPQNAAVPTSSTVQSDLAQRGGASSTGRPISTPQS
jgi:hypothetical protein